MANAIWRPPTFSVASIFILEQLSTSTRNIYTQIIDGVAVLPKQINNLKNVYQNIDVNGVTKLSGGSKPPCENNDTRGMELDFRYES